MDSERLFEILAREHVPMLGVFLRTTLHDPALEDDILQETLVTAWRTLDRYDQSRPFGRWLRGIASKLVLARRRQRALAPATLSPEVLDLLSDRLDALQRSPGDNLDEKLQSLRDCLEHLSDIQRHAVKLRYEEDCRGARLADALEVTLESAKKILLRGRKKLLTCMRKKLGLEGAVT